jgi:hypothetical protein
MKVARAKATRNIRYAIYVLGTPVCMKAAMCIIGIGSPRLNRVRRGEVDGRCLLTVRGPDGMPLKADSALSSCLTFLWRAMLLVYCSIQILLINRFHVVGPSDFDRP